MEWVEEEEEEIEEKIEIEGQGEIEEKIEIEGEGEIEERERRHVSRSEEGENICTTGAMYVHVCMSVKDSTKTATICLC